MMCTTNEGGKKNKEKETMQTEPQTIDDTESNTMEDTRNTISDKELSECDRENLSHIGLVQGGCGHVLFIKNPCGQIVGHDRDIRQVDFISAKNGSALIGNFLKDFIPVLLHTTIMQCVEQMKVAMSRRTFHFYAIPGKTFALSISSTETDYSGIAIEIEASGDSQEVSC